ncbi:transcriptional regulator TyrR [Vibrio quintilis]|uniref:HTH-type transcriptional regulatory protein TyrR n=1 Tax=Vibrio quintilis TaxID=1117707 RepID=A0A1M7Z318_9VIBR|nr:transcriptional regulator TyrR [Vibrio quintilis]SHO59046.1 Transcriptional regulatory protein TyrR [Vibrio quintilis]
MRLEVFCEDRLGLTRELLDILASRKIDLRGIEIDVSGIIYLNCPDIDFATFSELMAQIRMISGVKDVRKVQFMPIERHNTELISLLNNLPDAVLSIDMKGTIDMANYAALSLFAKQKDEVIGIPITGLIQSFNFSRWLEGNKARYREEIVINGLDYILEMMPVHIRNELSESVLASTMIILRMKDHASSGTPLMLPLSHDLGFEHFVGVSNRHKQLINQAKKLSLLEQPLLIEGETGTGKEMLARACHNRSERAAFPFLVLSCASMPDDVAETELFGHAPGTFNHQSGHKGIFELADGGTIFLDEIGEMSPHLQIKLLRFLQDGTFRRVGEEHEQHVDVRIIASTRHNLAGLAESGQFREDLFYRLNVLTITIPPLRERPADILPLLELFVTRHARQMGMKKPGLADEVVDKLSHCPWPGNMRQLENIVLRALTEIQDGMLELEHFHLPQVDKMSDGVGQLNLDGSLDDIMSDYEAKVLTKLYQSFPSSRKLAKRLSVSHTSIANKLRDYHIRKN